MPGRRRDLESSRRSGGRLKRPVDSVSGVVQGAPDRPPGVVHSVPGSPSKKFTGRRPLSRFDGARSGDAAPCSRYPNAIVSRSLRANRGTFRRGRVFLETLETSGMEHRPNTYDKPGTASGESGSICFLWFSPKLSQTFGEMTYNFMENWHKLTKRTLLTRKIF